MICKECGNEYVQGYKKRLVCDTCQNSKNRENYKNNKIKYAENKGVRDIFILNCY